MNWARCWPSSSGTGCAGCCSTCAGVRAATGTDEAVRVADYFLPEYDLHRLFHPTPATLLTPSTFYAPAHSRIATERYRNGREEHYDKKEDVSFLGFRTVVLVNGETSGGAELIAAALQDNQRARVAGQRTRGKASVQGLFETNQTYRTPYSLRMKLSTGMLLRPSGRNLHRFANSTPADDWGVRPDTGLENRVSADLSRQLEAWWLLQTLRPGTSNESLPLDDPATDPQQQAALQALVGGQ
jgi:hypothetical protein